MILKYIGEQSEKTVKVWRDEYRFIKGEQYDFLDDVGNKILTQYGAIFQKVTYHPILPPPAPVTPPKAELIKKLGRKKKQGNGI